MITEDAIHLLQQAEAIQAADAAVNGAMKSDGLVALPEKFKLHDIEAMLPYRRRQRAEMATSCVDSFCSYFKTRAEAGATVFVNDDMTAQAVLNLGVDLNPGHCDNTAKLKLVKSAAFDALLSVNGKPLLQKDAAEFLEDWNDLLQFYQGSTELTPGKAIAAVRKITIESARKLETTTQNFSDTASAFEQVTASSTEPLPEIAYFKCVPYEGLPERTFALRVSILTGEDKPRLVLRIQRLQLQLQEMANELTAIVQRTLSGTDGEHEGGIPVVRGSFQVGK